MFFAHLISSIIMLTAALPFFVYFITGDRKDTEKGSRKDTEKEKSQKGKEQDCSCGSLLDMHFGSIGDGFHG